MSDLAAALADPTELGEYDGKDVIRTSIIIRNTGDGLSESMAIAPQVLHIGDKGYVLLEYEVIDHQHPKIKGTDCLELKQILRAGVATIVDADFAKEKIDAQAERIQRAKDEAKGQGSLSTELLEKQHNDGDHQELVDGCPICDSERDAMEAEGEQPDEA